MSTNLTREQIIEKVQAARERGELPDLSNLNLSGLDLSDIDLHEADLKESDLQGTTLDKANLRMADLTKADASESSLQEADLYGANLNKTSLQQSDLRGANLSKAMLYGTDLSQANLQGADMSAALLYTANLQGAVLTNTDLESANLSKAELNQAVLCAANLREATLIESDLSDVDVRECDLHGATLRGAKLQGADLSTANLEAVTLVQASYNEQTRWPEGFTPPAKAVNSAAAQKKPQVATKFSGLQHKAQTKPAILYLHGFASSAQGTKAHYFEEKFQDIPQITFHAFEFTPTPRDFETMTLTGLISRLRQYLLDHDLAEQVSFIGSSLGALVALRYASQFEGVKKMLLLAPALAYLTEVAEEERQQWKETDILPVFHYHFNQELPLQYGYHVDGMRYQEAVPPAAPTLIIHGQKDKVVPIESSRTYIKTFPGKAQLLEVDSDHRMIDQLPYIWSHVQSFLLL